MKKERFKSIVLALLVITNLVLAERILVNEKLWLSGYNFFVSMRNLQKKNIVSVTKRLAMPENIVINTGYQSSRFVYTRNSEYFDAVYEATGDVLKSAFSLSQRDISAITVYDWYSALTSKSIYLNYPCSYTPSVFSALLGIGESELSVGDFSNIVINDVGNVFIEASGKYYKISTVSSEIAPIIEQAATENSDKESVINYSFDLNFDTNFGTQTTSLSPMIMIYSEPVLAHIIIPENPVANGVNVDDRKLSEVLTAFSINKNSARRYTEADGSLVYVENTGILKITPDGILTFSASENGLKLQGTSATSKIAGFIDNINSALNIDSDIALTTLSINDFSQEVKFDYMLDGYPVVYADKSAISATVTDGYLKSYTQILRNYTVSSETSYSPDFIEALDNTIYSYKSSMSEMHINKMYPAFLDNLQSDKININWYVEVDNVVAQ